MGVGGARLTGSSDEWIGLRSDRADKSMNLSLHTEKARINQHSCGTGGLQVH